MQCIITGKQSTERSVMKQKELLLTHRQPEL